MDNIKEINQGSYELIEAGGNNPLPINDSDYAWIVMEDQVNLFVTNQNEDGSFGIRNYICTANKGEAVFGIKQAKNIAVILVGEMGTVLKKVKISELKDELPEYIDKWIKAISRGIAENFLPPRRFKLIEEGENIQLEKGDDILSFDKILWVKNESGDLRFMGKENITRPQGSSFIPISNHIWIKAFEESTISAINTTDFISNDSELKGLEYFHDNLISLLKVSLDAKQNKEKRYLLQKQKNKSIFVNKALTDLALSIEPNLEIAGELDRSESPLFKCCHLIAKNLNFTLKKPPHSDESEEQDYSLFSIAKASKIRTRQVSLSSTWWKNDGGPLLGSIKETNQPVALLPISPGVYEIHDPVKCTREIINEKNAQLIDTNAYTLYRPFPNKTLNLWDLILFSLHTIKNDLKTFILMGIAAGFLGMAVPIATGIIFNSIVPNREMSILAQLCLVLFFTSLSAAMFQFVQGITLIRVEGKMKNAVQSAIMDRILSFPCSFFKKFSAGDLASRALGIDQIMTQVFEGLVIPSILGAIYASFCLVLLFFYDRQLAGIAAILSVAVFAAISIVTFLQLSNQRKEIDIQGQLSGFVFQLIQGISKLKVAGSQPAAFSKWAEKFSQQKKCAYNAGNIGNYLSIFNSIMPLISSVIIFSFVAMQTNQAHTVGNKVIATGNFLAFNAAFTGFLAAIIQLGASVATISGIVSLFERMKPILETLKEDDDKKQNPGELSGDIEVNSISFRYKEDSPLILNNISFYAKQEEFIAFVGPSGSGKSTILRHLLGFEAPEHGAIYYDGKDLSTLDLSSVRNQIGVVLQDSQLMAGDILYNIIGSSLLTVDDAWEAAAMAGIDEDIKAMPMGMHTYVSEGGQTFSGGQKQRLLIARAIARKPRIILFDEASSALDNKTQNIVTESINKLKATRIVIAHRLSTIIKADRIYVVENGRIVQTGTYEDLIKIDGPFKRIAERQLI